MFGLETQKIEVFAFYFLAFYFEENKYFFCAKTALSFLAVLELEKIDNVCF